MQHRDVPGIIIAGNHHATLLMDNTISHPGKICMNHTRIQFPSDSLLLESNTRNAVYLMERQIRTRPTFMCIL